MSLQEKHGENFSIIKSKIFVDPSHSMAALPCIMFRQFSLDGGTAPAVELINFKIQLSWHLLVFMAAWDTCFTLMSKLPEEDILRAILEIQLRKCQALKPLFFQIDGAIANSRKRTYNYL